MQNKINNDEGEENYPTESVKPISHKHKLVVDAYMKSGDLIGSYMSVYQGCTRASASDRGNKLIKLPSVLGYLVPLQQRLRERENIKKDDIVVELKDSIERFKHEGDNSNFIKAVDLLAKIAGLYSPSSSVNIQSQGYIEISFGGWNPSSPLPHSDEGSFAQDNNLLNSSNDDKIEGEDTDFAPSGNKGN